MTDEEVLQYYNEIEKWYGSLPSFEHEPIQFANKVKLYKYYKEREDDANRTDTISNNQ
jgi:hypothetical protein